MITPLSISLEEKQTLVEWFRKGTSALVRDRAHAILLSNQGLAASRIGTILFRAHFSVRHWIHRYQEAGMSSLFPRYRGNTNANKLTLQQKEQISSELKKPPSEYGLPFSFWTTRGLKKWIKTEFGVVYESDRSYHYLLRFSALSWKLPDKLDGKRDEAFIENRMEEIRKQVAVYLEDPHYEVLVADETQVQLEALTRRAWLNKGSKTILKVKRERIGQSFFGALNLKNHQCLLYTMPWQNQEETIKVLKKIKKVYPQKKICLIWDNAPWHQGKLVRSKLGKWQIFHNFLLVHFPPQSPDKNPQEHVWKYAKDAIANKQRETLDSIVKAFTTAITSHKFQYHL